MYLCFFPGFYDDEYDDDDMGFGDRGGVGGGMSGKSSQA